MEPGQGRFVLGPDRPDDDRRPRLVADLADVGVRVGADRESWQLALRDGRRMEDDPGVEGDDSLRRGEERVDIDLRDPRLLGDELTEADEERSENVDVDRSTAADPAKGAGSPGRSPRLPCRPRTTSA